MAYYIVFLQDEQKGWQMHDRFYFSSPDEKALGIWLKHMFGVEDIKGLECSRYLKASNWEQLWELLFLYCPKVLEL